MKDVLLITLKGIFRDRIFQGIMALAGLIVFIPSAASLSMRQVTELSITLSLSTISFIMLLLSVFLGATSMWKDIERRYTFSVVSLPISRTSYVFGKFFGIALFLVLTAFVLGCAAMISIKVSSMGYPTARPVEWGLIMAAIVFDAFKYILLVGVAMLLSAVSTSFFLPVFGTVSIFLVGTITQQVYDYLHTPASEKVVSAIVKNAALVLYYLLPNLQSFDLKVYAIYSIKPSLGGVLTTFCYGGIYTAVLLLASSLLFGRREMK